MSIQYQDYMLLKQHLMIVLKSFPV